MIKIVGLNRRNTKVSKFGIDILSSGNENSNKEWGYTFFYIKNNKKFSKSFMLEKGMCGSGYCSAQWLRSSYENELKEFPVFDYVPKKVLEVEGLQTCYDGNDYYTLYGYDDGYYPAANIEIYLWNWDKVDKKERK